jgi:hypothetical protein
MRGIARSKAGRVFAVFAVIVAIAALSFAAFAPASADGVGEGPQHWAHDGLTRSQIYFVDHTGAAWPVATVTYKWNEAHGVDSYYETSCPSASLHCVNVNEYDAAHVPGSCPGSATWYGCTVIAPIDAYNHMRSATVYLNNSTVLTAAQHRKSTCHELGHALGLNHNNTNASCMTQGASPPISQYPDQYDFDSLHNLYNHAN